ncbi:hypothetical protein P3339_14155 [Microbulbifer sp. MLAF003]|uniref:hypothetical protein n=1 Tax=unclassified Microbulbifer TaxID=2619833 RepID=UPI0024ADA0A8|nr:hypothetical protein [Microbulbifer sp. MLAF003]WHI49612.1 hypothetical protein P3339_14155 [Microbulbifer sp. MLAF003]
MSKLIEITATLVRNPYPDLPKLCAARTLPLHREEDFEAISILPVNSNPMMLNFAEHYRLIVELLGCIKSFEARIDTYLLRIQMPAGGRMPKEFLDEKVLMLQDVRAEEAFLQREGKPYIAIEDTLPRHPLEAGNNKIQIRIACEQDPSDLHWNLVEGISTKLKAVGFDAVEMTVKDRTA